jgi:hypothetical protein
MFVEIENEKVLRLIEEGILTANNFYLEDLEEEFDQLYLASLEELSQKEVELFNKIIALKLEEESYFLYRNSEFILESQFIEIIEERNLDKAREIFKKGKPN